MRAADCVWAISWRLSVLSLLPLYIGCADQRAPASNSESSIRTVPSSRDSVSSTPLEATPTVSSIKLLGNRTLSSATWDTLWKLRGTFDDTLLLQPIQLLAQDSLLFVADYGNRNVQAFNALNGERLWVAGGAGQGPKEFAQMRLFAAPGNQIGVADESNQRVSYISMAGEFENASRVAFPPGIYGICEVGGRHFVAGSRSASPRLLEWDLTSDAMIVHMPAWLSYLDSLDMIRGQFSLGKVGESRCALRHAFGPYDLLVFDSALQLTARVAPRERITLAQVESLSLGGRPAYSAKRGSEYGWRYISTVGNALFVTFAGASPQQDRLIEEFALPELNYVGTHLAPHRIRGLAGEANRLTVLMQDTTGYYFISQLRRMGR